MERLARRDGCKDKSMRHKRMDASHEEMVAEIETERDRDDGLPRNDGSMSARRGANLSGNET
jgi:hypothetical protein